MILNCDSIADYRLFLAIRSLPTYRFRGSIADYPVEYEHLIGGQRTRTKSAEFDPCQKAFDYQRDIARIAFERKKFCIFADCGLGKTLMFLDYARNCMRVMPKNKAVLIVSPLMVIPQTIYDAKRDSSIGSEVRAIRRLEWLATLGMRPIASEVDELVERWERQMAKAEE